MSRLILLMLIFSPDQVASDNHQRQQQRLECYFCEHTESRIALPEQRDRSCFLNFSYENNVRLCALGDVCKISITFNNGAFYEIHRDCEDKCHPRCLTDGYGLSMKTCTFCCDFDRCNNRTDRSLFGQAIMPCSKSENFMFYTFIVFLLFGIN